MTRFKKHISSVDINLFSSTIPSSERELMSLILSFKEIDDYSRFIDIPHPDMFKASDVGIDGEQLQIASAKISNIALEQKTVVIAGDYDVDGICATAIIWLALKAIGLTAKPFIPDRIKHGYGLNEKSLVDILILNPDLIITVDNGIVAGSVVAQLAKQKIPVIVTDHHESDLENDDLIKQYSEAVIHSTRLCGASVAWILAKEILSTHSLSNKLLSNDLLDLVGLATIADQVPLIGANRSFAKYGLNKLRETKREGLMALFKEAGVNQDKIDERTVGFQLAPRLNALGRLSNGLEALRLIVGSNRNNAIARAKKINLVNQDRQLLTVDMYGIATAQTDNQENEKLLIVYDTSFHEGIIGLIAGRCVETTGKPCIAIAKSNGNIKGSVRSVPGFHVTDFLRKKRSLFIDLGGHEMAAGFSASANKLDEIIEVLHSFANEQINTDLLIPKLDVVCELPGLLINLDVAQLLQQLRPYGQGNLEPFFLLKKWRVLSIQQIGKHKQHCKYMLQPSIYKSSTTLTQDQAVIEALHWNSVSTLASIAVGHDISVIASIEINEFRNLKRPVLVIKKIID